uniref:WAT1-related protein n=1 Tax=Chenopodium quinoa TaxID=63459 RepID=A0A803LT51_CHEQI
MEGKGIPNNSLLEKLKPYIAMICLQFGYAGMNIVTKVSLNGGMSHYVLVVYRHAFATAVIAPFALVCERGKRPKMTLLIFAQMFVLGLLGPLIDQNFYYLGLKYTSPTYACAMSNMLPALTFVMAVLCRMEKVHIKKLRCQAKVVGTLVTVAGAMLMTLYKGHVVNMVWSSHIHPAHTSSASVAAADKDWAKGSILLILATLAWAAFFILQGIITSGIAYYVQGIVMEKRGPVFVTAFSPLMMIIVAFMGSFILAEKIYVGGIMGAVLIVMGLYSVLWGKYKEYKEQEIEEIPEAIKGCNNFHSNEMGTIVEDHELDDVESQRNVEASRVPNVVVSSPMPQPPMLAMEAPMKGSEDK